MIDPEVSKDVGLVRSRRAGRQPGTLSAMPLG